MLYVLYYILCPYITVVQARDAVKQRLSSLNFDYSMPHPNFDRTKVKGLVANLTSIPPQHQNKSQALEIVAGGKLYNVVVEDEKVGKDLLQNGKLKKRVTIIPLNKINSFVLNAQVCLFLAQLMKEGCSFLPEISAGGSACTG